MMLALLVVAMMVGLGVGFLIGSYNPELKKYGQLPRWKVDAIVGETIEALTKFTCNGPLEKKFKKASASLKFSMTCSKNWVIKKDGSFDVSPTDGWQFRLRCALAHAVHYQIFGDADPLRKNRLWFEAALGAQDAGPR